MRTAVLIAIACAYWAAVALAETATPVLRNEPGWPVVFELDVGQAVVVAPARPAAGPAAEPGAERARVGRTVKLLSVEHEWEPDFYIAGNPDRKTISSASVVVEVDGRRAKLLCRPYQSPTPVNGLLLYVEVTRLWAEKAHLGRVAGVTGDVRFSCVAEGDPWGPPMAFPIGDYRWRSSSYNNTWRSLVPYNRLYYHAGEDWGVIPDRLTVAAPFAGTVVTTPLPKGDGQSNGLSIEHDGGGLVARLAHMNIETIDPRLLAGTRVTAGQALGQTGMTWGGRKAQTHDPHLHVGFTVPLPGRADRTPVSTFPFLTDAYFRTYKDDTLLPIAGGYAFTVPGRDVALDGSRSLARPGRRVVAHRWKLSDGREVDGAAATVRYDEPGVYCEELIVRGDDGSEDRDFAQVRVWGPRARGAADPPAVPLAYGWLHSIPVRGVRPGTEVTFWNRLRGTRGDVTLDFGDGTPPVVAGAEHKHAYRAPGVYTVTLSGCGPASEPVTVKARVVVEP